MQSEWNRKAPKLTPCGDHTGNGSNILIDGHTSRVIGIETPLFYRPDGRGGVEIIRWIEKPEPARDFKI